MFSQPVLSGMGGEGSFRDPATTISEAHGMRVMDRAGWSRTK
jgi:hypothetical protein